MEAGYSRELFLEWCADSKNTVIVTGRSEQRTLGSKLIHMATGGSNVNRHLTLEIKRRIRLEGAELEQYRLKRREKEQEAARIRFAYCFFLSRFMRNLIFLMASINSPNMRFHYLLLYNN